MQTESGKGEIIPVQTCVSVLFSVIICLPRVRRKLLKQCATCSRTYDDDTLAYCLDDGSMLVARDDPQATLRIPAARVTDMPATQVAPPPPLPRYQTPKQSNRWPIYVLVTFALIVLLGGVVTLLIFGYSRMSASSSSNTNQDSEKQAPLSSSQSPTPSPSESPSPPTANSLVGVWRTSVVENGVSMEITVTFLADGQTRYLFTTAQGRRATDYGTWQYSDGILFEKFSNGASGRGSIRWIDQDNIELTIIDNGVPAYAGLKRRYRRIS